jgi:hypothetical protein
MKEVPPSVLAHAEVTARLNKAGDLNLSTYRLQQQNNW